MRVCESMHEGLTPRNETQERIIYEIGWIIQLITTNSFINYFNIFLLQHFCSLLMWNVKFHAHHFSSKDIINSS